MLQLLNRVFRRAISQEVVEYGKNPACQDAIEATNKIVFDALVTPKLNPALVEEMKIYREANLTYQVVLCQHRMRCWAARSLGFTETTLEGAVTLLTGRKAVDAKPGRFDFSGWTDWLQNGDDDQYRRDHPYSFHRSSEEEWHFYDQPSYRVSGSKERVMFGPPDMLRIPIPIGAALRLIKMRAFDSGLKQAKYALKQKLFDDFTVLAPEWCWANPQPKDPILFGVITGPYNRATKEFDHRLFMLARWE